MKKIFNPSNCWFKEICCDSQTENCNHGCGWFANMKNQVELSGLPETLKVSNKLITPNEDTEAFFRLNEIKQNINEFVQQGENLYIYGNCFGNGKTTWASKLMMTYLANVSNHTYEVKGCHGKFISTTHYLHINSDFTQSEYAQKLYWQIRNADLVILDDIAVYEPTKQELKSLYDIVDGRISDGMSTIFTGNKDGKQLCDMVGGRLASRIWEASECIELKAPSVRGLELD